MSEHYTYLQGRTVPELVNRINDYNENKVVKAKLIGLYPASYETRGNFLMPECFYAVLLVETQ